MFAVPPLFLLLFDKEGGPVDMGGAFLVSGGGGKFNGGRFLAPALPAATPCLCTSSPSPCLPCPLSPPTLEPHSVVSVLAAVLMVAEWVSFDFRPASHLQSMFQGSSCCFSFFLFLDCCASLTSVSCWIIAQSVPLRCSSMTWTCVWQVHPSFDCINFTTVSCSTLMLLQCLFFVQ